MLFKKVTAKYILARHGIFLLELTPLGPASNVYTNALCIVGRMPIALALLIAFPTNR